jgi:branched-chain amino acid transport system ATP-binding protein
MFSGSRVLSLRGLSVRYGRSVPALLDVTLDVPADGVLAVLGGSAAGKSTLLRAVSGGLAATGGIVADGEIHFEGNRLDGHDQAKRVRLGIAAVPAHGPVFTGLTVAENLRAGGFGAGSRSARRRAAARVEELFPMLAGVADTRAGRLGAAEQQLVAIGRALMSDPKLLLLDEPSLRLPAATVAEVVRIVRDVGITVLLADQRPSVALQVATHALVLELGRTVLAGPAYRLVDEPVVRRLAHRPGGPDHDDPDAVRTVALPIVPLESAR